MNVKDLNVEAASAAIDEHAEKAKYHFNRALEERVAEFKRALADLRAQEIPDSLLATVGRGDAEMFVASLDPQKPGPYMPIGEANVRLSMGPLQIDLGSTAHLERFNGARFVLLVFPRKA